MADLRDDLAGIVAGIERRAPYAAVWLSARQGLRISVDNREERVVERPPAAGAVITAFDGATIHERAIGSFDRTAIEQGGARAGTGSHGRQGSSHRPGA